ncbi:MAG: peptide chain release factor 1 [Armatimonadetes bacterium]|nr:peptide chain release factor 1 [Armatimonadota bacterium]
MFEKLGEVEERYEALEDRLADPNVVQNQQEYRQIAKQHSDLSEVVAKWREYVSIKKQLAETTEMLSGKLDEDMKEMALAELEELKGKIQDLEQDLRLMLLPKDPIDEKDVIVEIRAGTGGEEAGLFCADLLRMYTRYAERQGWQADLMSSVETGIGGFKEAVIEITGKGAYSKLKFEAGIHRVQRVPATESSGRIHTSAATVSVLAEADEVDVQISNDDLEIDTYRSAGAGGQNVQKNETAIRITHKPSGIVVTCQDERSQLQNKERAMKILRAQLLENAQNAQQQEIASIRRLMVGSGDRSEKIRTYNYPQNRITDHRINYDIFNLPGFMDGDITDMIDRLSAVDQAEKLKAAAS